MMKKFFLKYWPRLDWIITVSVLLLAGMGLLSLYSSSIGEGDFINFQKQLIFLAVGIFLMFLISSLDYRILRNDPHLILILYIFCLLALAGLFFFAPEIRNVQRWYKLGPVHVGPIEFTKLVLIILLAKYFSMRHVEMYRLKHIFLSGFYVLIPALLVFFQPDLGSVLVLVFVWLVILLMSGIKLKVFLLLALCGILIFVLAWPFLLKDYQKERIITFYNSIVFPEQADVQKAGWSQNQAKIAIGSAGFLGQGFSQGSQTQYGFLPEPQTDFIFSAVAEEFGFLAVMVMAILFSLLVWRIIKIAAASQTNFIRLFALGFATLITIQVFINIGMNLGLLPVMGIPLPFISYGGSSLIAFFIGAGIIQSMRHA